MKAYRIAPAALAPGNGGSGVPIWLTLCAPAPLRLLIVAVVTLRPPLTPGCLPTLTRISCSSATNLCVGNARVAGSVPLVAGASMLSACLPARVLLRVSLVFSTSPAWDWVDIPSR